MLHFLYVNVCIQNVTSKEAIKDIPVNYLYSWYCLISPMSASFWFLRSNFTIKFLSFLIFMFSFPIFILRLAIIACRSASLQNAFILTAWIEKLLPTSCGHSLGVTHYFLKISCKFDYTSSKQLNLTSSPPPSLHKKVRQKKFRQRNLCWYQIYLRKQPVITLFLSKQTSQFIVVS